MNTQKVGDKSVNQASGKSSGKTVKRIFSVKVKTEVDECADTDWIGEYTDEVKDHCIIRDGEHSGEFVADIKFRECWDCGEQFGTDKDVCPKCASDCWNEKYDEVPDRGREYRFFEAYAGGEKPDLSAGSEYRKYAMQNYRRMEGLNRDDWWFVGVYAVAKAGVSVNGGKDFIRQEIRSAGLWGIESDSSKGYLQEIGQEQLNEIKDELISFGFGRSVVGKAIKNAEFEEQFEG